ncbi:hypothetical protein ASE96_05000 [Arthrobacter sp. Leaf69]|nr:hypothetical protein ASE96_05000 [Arthrobacter sp. Leaf69]
MESLNQQHELDNEQQLTSAMLSSLLDRLDAIEKSQREVVTSISSVAQNFLSTWEGMEQTQRLTQQLYNYNVSASDSHGKTLTTLATTQSEMLELMASSRVVKLPDGSTVRAGGVSAHALTQDMAVQIKAFGTTNLKLAEAVRRQRTVSVDHDKLAKYLVPELGKQLLAHEHAMQTAFADVSRPMLAELEESRAALNEAGAQVSEQVRRAGEQVAQLRGTVTWRTLGQISAALLPLAIAVSMVFGTAQTVWAAFGLQPILYTFWIWFLDAHEWYWRLAIAGTAFAVLIGFGWLTVMVGRKLHEFFRGY